MSLLFAVSSASFGHTPALVIQSMVIIKCVPIFTVATAFIYACGCLWIPCGHYKLIMWHLKTAKALIRESDQTAQSVLSVCFLHTLGILFTCCYEIISHAKRKKINSIEDTGFIQIQPVKTKGMISLEFLNLGGNLMQSYELHHEKPIWRNTKMQIPDRSLKPQCSYRLRNGSYPRYGTWLAVM